MAPTINYYAGFVAWSPGQLDAEIAHGSWHLIKADRATIFEHDSATIWFELIKKLEGTWVLMENASAADTPL
jgi:putative transcriptional regulator